MREDVYYQRGAPDPILDAGVVLGIVRQYVPGAQELRGVDESGGEARTYAVDDDVIVKVQRPHQLRRSTSLQKEAFFLRQLEGQPKAKVPRVLGYGKQGTVEYICMTRIPGTAVRNTKLSPEQREEMLYELGKTLYFIHNINIQPFYDSGLFPDNDKTAADVRERLKHYFDKAMRGMSANLAQSEIESAHKQADELIGQITEVCVKPRHADPSDEHTFVKGGIFSGVIDFADAYISHPSLDLRRWPHADRKTLLNGYKSAGVVEDSFIAVCEITFTVENILSELRLKHT